MWNIQSMHESVIHFKIRILYLFSVHFSEMSYIIKPCNSKPEALWERNWTATSNTWRLLCEKPTTVYFSEWDLCTYRVSLEVFEGIVPGFEINQSIILITSKSPLLFDFNKLFFIAQILYLLGSNWASTFILINL